MPNRTRDFFELLIIMTQKELRARYKNTFFGFLWIIVNPILQMLVIGFIFRLFIKEPIDNYYLYLLVGLLIWNFFSLSLTKAAPSIVNERSLVKKAKFARAVIPLSLIFSNFVHTILAFAILLLPLIFLKTISLVSLPGLILGVFLLIILTVGLSLLTSALNVRFRDISFLVQASLILWFYATPIVYSINVVPTGFIWIWRLNPLTSVVQLFQSALVNSPPPGPVMLLSNTAIIFIVCFLGVTIFRLESKNFDDWV